MRGHGDRANSMHGAPISGRRRGSGARPSAGEVTNPVGKAGGGSLTESFHLEIRQDGETELVMLEGELDLVYSGDVATALAGISAARIVVDLSRLEFIDSSGISALLVARRRAEEEGNVIELRGATGAARRVFTAAGLLDVLDD